MRLDFAARYYVLGRMLVVCGIVSMTAAALAFLLVGTFLLLLLAGAKDRVGAGAAAFGLATFGWTLPGLVAGFGIGAALAAFGYTLLERSGRI